MVLPLQFRYLYATFLLAQFREKRAYKSIVKLISRPGEIPFDLFSDALNEDLGRNLASVCRANTYLIEKLIENKNTNEFVRSLSIASLVTLVAIGEKSRDEILTIPKVCLIN